MHVHVYLPGFLRVFLYVCLFVCPALSFHSLTSIPTFLCFFACLNRPTTSLPFCFWPVPCYPFFFLPICMRASHVYLSPCHFLSFSVSLVPLFSLVSLSLVRPLLYCPAVPLCSSACPSISLRPVPFLSHSGATSHHRHRIQLPQPRLCSQCIPYN